jgi:hypothetical protein
MLKRLMGRDPRRRYLRKECRGEGEILERLRIRKSFMNMGIFLR